MNRRGKSLNVKNEPEKKKLDRKNEKNDTANEGMDFIGKGYQPEYVRKKLK